MKRWFVFAATASAMAVFGPQLVAALELGAYRDQLGALAIALLMQPWIIYQLDN